MHDDARKKPAAPAPIKVRVIKTGVRAGIIVGLKG
jgi:hypothetical protein